ncbi:MAG: flagellar assembly protein FliW [bacterium]|nr:flagellar assembly protein FliW [bacterium]
MSVLTTKAMGQVEIAPEDILTFPEGLFGFPDVREFTVLAEKGDSPFLWLQCVNDPELAFVIIDPALFISDYTPQLAPGDLELLQTKQIDDCDMYVIVTIPEKHPEKMTANLQGPILLNKSKQIGRQVISHHSKHFVRVQILQQVEG